MYISIIHCVKKNKAKEEIRNAFIFACNSRSIKVNLTSRKKNWNIQQIKRVVKK
jgi:hypothetical protein